jgi:hypothetical protein
MGFFYYEFDPTDLNSYKIIYGDYKKADFPPNFKRLRMGNVFFKVKTMGNSTLFLIDKIMLTNFPNLEMPTTELKYVNINGDTVGMEDEKILLDSMFIPTYGQKKDTLVMSTALALCSSKQAVYEYMKKEISRHFSSTTYLNRDKWVDWQERCVRDYRKAIERLKSL